MEFDPEEDELLDRRAAAYLEALDKVATEHYNRLRLGHEDDLDYMSGLLGWMIEGAEVIAGRFQKDFWRIEMMRIHRILHGEDDEEAEAGDDGRDAESRNGGVDFKE